MAQFYTALH